MPLPVHRLANQVLSLCFLAPHIYSHHVKRCRGAPCQHRHGISYPRFLRLFLWERADCIDVHTSVSYHQNLLSTHFLLYFLTRAKKSDGIPSLDHGLTLSAESISGDHPLLGMPFPQNTSTPLRYSLPGIYFVNRSTAE